MSKDTKVNKIDILRASPLSVELTDEQCRRLADVITVRQLKDGEILIKEGHMDHCVHAIIEGMVAVVKESGGGTEELLHILKPSELAGAMGFIDGLEHSATLRSLGKSKVFSLDRDKFESLLANDPVLVYRVMRAIIRCVHSIVRRMNTQYVELTNYITKQHGRY